MLCWRSYYPFTCWISFSGFVLWIPTSVKNIHLAIAPKIKENPGYKYDQINYRILRTIGRYFFSSTRWLRPIVHIDLYKDEVKKIWNPIKKISIKMTILFTVYLEFAVGFFVWIRRLKSSMFLGNKSILTRGAIPGKKCSTSEKNQ
jgi:hypothetical protein